MKQIITILFLSGLTLINATIINVPDDQATIQLGINSAIAGDTVLVAPGIYIESTIYIASDIVVGSYFITTGDTTYIDSTIIDGNAQRMVFMIDWVRELSGFTIRNGFCNDRAGGIWVRGSGTYTSIIANNIITGNQSTMSDGGGGIQTWLGHTVIRNNKIINNHSAGAGGGICVSCYGQATISDNIISNNTTASDGGGIACQDTVGSLIRNNLIRDNSSNHYGGGIYCTNEANPIIKENNIIGNSAIFFGSAIECTNNSNPAITNNIITDNLAAMYTIQFINCSPLLRNNTFYNNSSSCVIQCSSSNAIITNNILATNAGTAIYSSASNVTVSNNNFYNQPLPLFSGDLSPDLGIITQTNANGDSCDVYCNIYGLDPCFVNAANSDFHLLENSPCIDAGDPASPLDPDGTIADMGAFYFHQSGILLPPQNIIVEIIGSSVHLNWDAVTNATSYKVFSSDDPYTGFVEDTSGSFVGEIWSTSIVNEKKFYYIIAVQD